MDEDDPCSVTDAWGGKGPFGHDAALNLGGAAGDRLGPRLQVFAQDNRVGTDERRGTAEVHRNVMQFLLGSGTEEFIDGPLRSR
jgi:hypothetical protein